MHLKSDLHILLFIMCCFLVHVSAHLSHHQGEQSTIENMQENSSVCPQ